MRCEGKKTVDTPFEIGVVPARNVKRRDTDTVKRLTGIKRGPVFPEFRVVKPIKNIGGQAFPSERGVAAKWQHTGLCAEVRPCRLERVACLAQPAAPGIGLQHL